MSVPTLRYALDISPSSTWLTVTTSQAARASLLYVQELGVFYAGSRYYTERQGLRSFLIKFTLSGKGVVQYAGEEYTVSTNQLFWVDCKDQQYYATAAAESNWDVIWVHFFGTGANQYYDLFLSQNSGSHVLHMPSGNSVQDRLNALIAMYTDTVGNFLIDIDASEQLSSLLLEIIRSSAEKKAGSKAPAFVSQAKEYLSMHYQKNIRLDDLSSIYHINKYHLLRQFKRYTGLSPNEFLTQARLGKAKEFLRATDNTVSVIASLVGIPNTTHFINLFKKHEQTTPAAYRKYWHNNQP